MAEAQMTPAMTLEYLQFLADQVKGLDSSISQASGQGAAAKKAIREKITGEVKADADKIVGELSKKFEKVSDRVLVGVLELLDSVTTALKERADKIVSEEQAAAKGEVSGNTEELRDRRKKAVTAFNSLKNLLEDMAGVDTSSVSIPKRGGGGKKGTGTKRTRTKGYDFYIDNKKLSDSQNTLSGVAFYAVKGGTGTIKEAEGQQSAYLKGVLAENKIAESPTEWGEGWKITLKNGKTVEARKRPPEPEGEGISDAEAEALAEVPANA